MFARGADIDIPRLDVGPQLLADAPALDALMDEWRGGNERQPDK
jgi:hypothetical protein